MKGKRNSREERLVGKILKRLFRRSFYQVKTLGEYISKVKERLKEFGYKTNGIKTDSDLESFLKEKGFIGKKEVNRK